MIYHAPKRLPSFAAMADDVAARRPDVIAEYLGVTLQTYKRWVLADDAPRSAAMALFWVTRYGISLHDCDIVNSRNMLNSQVRCLTDANNMLRARIARLEEAGSFGSANMPYYQPERVALFTANGQQVQPQAVALGA